MILFLTGASASGKTYLRKEVWPDAKCVDLYDYQQLARLTVDNTFNALIEADERSICALEEYAREMKEGEVVIYEAPLSGKGRRKNYAKRVRDALKEAGKEYEQIICIVCEPEEEDIETLIRSKYRINPKEVPSSQYAREYEANGELKNYYVRKNVKDALTWRKHASKPETSEGFDQVMIVKPILQ